MFFPVLKFSCTSILTEMGQGCKEVEIKPHKASLREERQMDNGVLLLYVFCMYDYQPEVYVM